MVTEYAKYIQTKVCKYIFKWYLVDFNCAVVVFIPFFLQRKRSDLTIFPT
jgi:hypothetical protein